MNQQESQFSLPLRGDAVLARGWLYLALASLIIAGLLTILVVSARAPILQDVLPFVDLFRAVLVVHVDLTVLVWFSAFAGLFWTLGFRNHCVICGWVALLLAWLGALLMSVALFVGNPEPVMANYIPVLRSPTFLAGLLAFAAGFTVLVLRAIYASLRDRAWSGREGALRFALFTSALAGLAALIVFDLAYRSVPKTLEARPYYEMLFWGGGHLLQFVYTQLMLVAWLWLASVSGAIPRLTARVAVGVFTVGVAAILLTPFVLWEHGPETAEYRLFFTHQMKYGGGIAAVLVTVAVLVGLWRAGAPPSGARAERSTLWTSLVVFGAGGVIGFLISGSNVTIPAHYHGSIVGVTLAFMGAAYHLLPKLGFGPISQRLAVWQAWIYCVGQLMHITGLAWSGGYGVQRKTAGAAQGLDSIERIVSMGFMGLGGFVAIVGGILFLVVVFKSLLGRRSAQNTT